MSTLTAEAAASGRSRRSGDMLDGVLRDPMFHRIGGARCGWDGCRVPLPSTSADDASGFSSRRIRWSPTEPAVLALTRGDSAGRFLREAAS